jgi:IS30 family transposase
MHDALHHLSCRCDQNITNSLKAAWWRSKITMNRVALGQGTNENTNGLRRQHVPK